MSPGRSSPREEEIAATLMQWLGSPVGMGWVEETLRKAREAERKATPEGGPFEAEKREAMGAAGD